MTTIHLTGPMQDYVQTQVKSGAYADASDVVRAAIRLLMERDGARQFYALRADLEAAVAAAEDGDFDTFDPVKFR